nr:immunoglobulin heavy chain junction region [Macaca mulatta]MOV35784.1 immunoglobulin heavy chain junction region [Macaca mulatta]MOV35848.1 immunoglobulin heavy chain junction region [Macaca mulatta]MOV35867.1 immunoglobulin heavy chain junction region [Macaca mulatta]MOV35872.1 immunoglobulin heavy chain junction region [Macaca mulatta]
CATSFSYGSGYSWYFDIW